MAPAHDPEELRRFTRDIPLPAYLASRGYTAQPDPEYRHALLLTSPKGKEALSVSNKGGVWLYNDRNDPQNKGTLINWAQRHGAANLGVVRKGLRPMLEDERLSELRTRQNDLESHAESQRREAGRAELEAFVRDIPLPAFLEKHGYELDARESSKNSLKYRGDAGVLLVSQQRDGAWVYWNATADQDKGTITQFCHNNLGAANLGEVRKMLRPELGGANTWTPPANVQARAGRGGQARDVSEEWEKLPGLDHTETEPARHYLNGRGIHNTIKLFESSIKAEPVQGHVNAAVAHYQYRDGEEAPRLTGWERKGPGKNGQSFNGFSGQRGLALLGKPEGDYTLVLCESAIDALSCAELDARFDPDGGRHTVYASTAGTPGRGTDRTLTALLQRHPPHDIVLGLDDDARGREMSDHLLGVIRDSGCNADVAINVPRDKKDWNAQLQLHAERGELDMLELQHGRHDRISLPVEPGRPIDWDAVQTALDAPWPPAARTQTPELSLEGSSPPRPRYPRTDGEQHKEQARNMEAELRAIWAEQGVSVERQNEILADIEAKAQPGTPVGPFVVGGVEAEHKEQARNMEAERAQIQAEQQKPAQKTAPPQVGFEYESDEYDMER